MFLEKVPRALRGELTRWLIEVRSGMYIGHVSALVRDRLWQKCSTSQGNGVIFQAWSTNNEQHFKMRIEGDQDRSIIDWEGLQLIQEKIESKAMLKKVGRKKKREMWQ